MTEDEITNGSEGKEKPEPTNQPDKQSTTRTKPKQLSGYITLWAALGAETQNDGRLEK